MKRPSHIYARDVELCLCMKNDTDVRRWHENDLLTIFYCSASYCVDSISSLQVKLYLDLELE